MWRISDKKDKQGNIIVPKDRPNRLGKREQLCWNCKRAVNKCQWSSDFIPIKGWDAEKDADSYKIYDCPSFCQG